MSPTPGIHNCNGQWEGSVCGSWGKGSHLGNRGARPARKGKGPAVGSRQRRRRDIATWTLVQETDSPRLQETVMHRVSAFVRCTAVIQYSHDRNHASLYYLFQENKSFGTCYHLHSSSDVREVVSSTIIIAVSSDVRHTETISYFPVLPPYKINCCIPRCHTYSYIINPDLPANRKKRNPPISCIQNQ
jgi:hypothetical protein